MSTHRFDFILNDDGDLTTSLVCLDPSTCPPVWEEHADRECHCVDPNCGCREDDHEADHGYINDLGPECRCYKIEGSCFYQHMLDEIQLEGFKFNKLRISVVVDIVGGSWDDPAEVTEKATF